MKRVLLFTVIMSLIVACENDQTVHAYVVVKPNDEDSAVNEWRPVMRVSYHVESNKVITEVAGLLDEYHDCNVEDKNNWECSYKDDRGVNSFGFKNGNYWDQPGWGEDVKHVTRWEYNMIRCKWYQYDNGRFKGMFSCLRTYI